MNKLPYILFATLLILPSFSVNVPIQSRPEVMRSSNVASFQTSYIHIGINQSLTLLNCSVGDALNFTYTLNSTMRLMIEMTPWISTDYDLYVKWDGTQPSITDYDCRDPGMSGEPEICESELGLPERTYHFMVHHYEGTAGHFNISVTGFYTVHNLNTTHSYPTIQDAINTPATLDRHTIRVDAGTYLENVIVNKQLNLAGDPERNTEIRAANSSRHTIEVVSNNVGISKFNITGATEGLLQASGIYIHDAENSSISYNHIMNNHYGIHLAYSNNTVIDSNVVYSNWYNIYLSVASNHNTLMRNEAFDSRYGVVLWMGSNNNFVFNNVLHDNGRSGIALGYSKFNTIFNNYIAHNRMGVEIQQPSMYNVISSNTVHSNYEYGVNMGTNAASSNNTVYQNNIINNTIQAHDPGINIWNHYYPLGGNYWDDYTGSDLFGGPYQNESTPDGIGDAPYTINSNNTDNYPLMNPYIVGDVSRDGKVDMKDVGLAAAAFGSYPGHPRWNPLADLTGQQILPDDKVDIIDLILIIKHYGQAQP